MAYLIPHTTDPLQTQNFTHEGYNLTLTTRFNSVFGFWNFDLYNNETQEYITQSEAFATGAPSLTQSELPFVFVMGASILEVYIIDKEEYYANVWAQLSVYYRE